MNPTIEKFGYPATLLKDMGHWVVLLRPGQVTLGSLVLAAKGDETAFSALPPAAFAELGQAIATIERVLAGFCRYERINYLMLMMVDPNVHFHVIPRYSEARSWGGCEFPDTGWPAAPQLGSAIQLSAKQIAELCEALSLSFR